MARADRSKLLSALLSKLRSAHPAAVADLSAADAATAPVDAAPADSSAAVIAEKDPALRELIRSMLLWDSTTSRAEGALRRLDRALVDVNELRACIPAEIAQYNRDGFVVVRGAQYIGPNYAKAEDRAIRLRQVLNDLFTREFAVTMSHLAAMTKREARTYLDGLAAAPEYVRDRVFLLALGGHALPVDDRILSLLLTAKVVEPGTTPEAASAFLERTIRAGEAAEAHALLQAAADELTASAIAQRPASAKATSRTEVRSEVRPETRPESRPTRARAAATPAKRSPASSPKPTSRAAAKPASSARKRGQ